MIAYNLELYEEGEVKHINDVWPSSLYFTAVSIHSQHVYVKHILFNACAENTLSCYHALAPSTLELSNSIAFICMGKGGLDLDH